MDYAVIESGGKQFRVQVGDRVSVERLPGERGAKVYFEKVLMASQKDQVSVGNPFLPKAKVTGVVERQRKTARVRIFKMKPKKNIRKRRGHRQSVTDVRIQDISV